MDKYDKAIEYLKENPDKICTAWFDGFYGHYSPAFCLFQAVTETRTTNARILVCLTMVKDDVNKGHAKDKFLKEDDDIINGIALDDRIPDLYSKINIDNLHIFAEWQRKIDKLKGR